MTTDMHRSVLLCVHVRMHVGALALVSVFVCVSDCLCLSNGGDGKRSVYKLMFKGFLVVH